MKRKRYFLSTACAILCLVIVVAVIVINGLGHSHAATGPTTTGKEAPPSPSAVVDGNIYYGSDATSSYALNTRTGALLWRYQVSGRVTSSVFNRVQHIVYMGSTKNTVYALNYSTGSLLWQYHVYSTVTLWPAPIINSILYLGTTKGIYALSASHGQVLWHYTAGPNTSIDWKWSIVNGAVYFVSSDGIVHALTASDGARLWQQPLGISGSISSVVNGVVYVITNNQYPIVDSAIYALSVTGGSLLWHYTMLYTREGGGASLTFVKDRLYAIAYLGHGSSDLSVLDAATGTLIWPKQQGSDSGPLLELRPFTILHGVMYLNTYFTVYAVRVSDGTTLWTYHPSDDVAKMIVANNMVYLHHGIYESGPITAHRATDGTLLWSYQPQDPSSMLSIVNGVIYAVSSNNIYTINVSNGTLLWNYAAAAGVIGIINGVVYLYDWNTSTFFALNASTGTTLWSHAAAAAGISIINGVLYFYDVNTSTFFALNASTGSILWSHVLSKSKVYRVQMVIKGVVYVQSNYNDIYAFDSSTGTLLWRYPTGS